MKTSSEILDEILDIYSGIEEMQKKINTLVEQSRIDKDDEYDEYVEAIESYYIGF